MFDFDNDKSEVTKFMELIEAEIEELGGSDMVTEERADGYVTSVVQFCGNSPEKFIDLLSSTVAKGLLACNEQPEDWDGEVMLIANPATPYMVGGAVYNLIDKINSEYKDQMLASVIYYFMCRCLEIGGSAVFARIEPNDLGAVDWDSLISRILSGETP